jgi:hypothetical protein
MFEEADTTVRIHVRRRDRGAGRRVRITRIGR